MSLLESRLRPWAVFDAGDLQHREWYYKFLVTNSWRHCPVRFAPGDEAVELIGWIQRELLLHYGKKEFKTVRKPTKQPLKAEVPLTDIMEDSP
jgi:hypothetical protein